MAMLAAWPVAADIRVATYTVDFWRRGPGLLLDDIRKGKAEDAARAAAIIAAVSPDVMLLNGIDYDAGGQTLAAFAGMIGAAYPYRLAALPNTGMATGLDMDADGRLGSPRDAQGYGDYAGQGGMAILSKLPLGAADTALTELLWRDAPNADLPLRPDGTPFFPAEILAVQRLSTTGHWIVPVILPGGGEISLLTWYATPPVFDGPEDRNGKRNADELRLWLALLDGRLDIAAPKSFVVLGNANLDPARGDGAQQVMARFLADPRLQDPFADGPADTVDFGKPPGRMRVDYVLPSADLTVSGAGVFWPAPDEPGHDLVSGEGAPRHRLVWVDLAVD